MATDRDTHEPSSEGTSGGGDDGHDWYDPRRWYDEVKQRLPHPGRALEEALDRRNKVSPGLQGVDVERDLRGHGDKSGAFADRGAGEYFGRGEDMKDLADQLGRLARGEDSYSAEQLRQSLGQTLAAQQSAAAGARPGNAAMAARNAAQNMSRQQSGLAGQQSLAGIAERQSAAQSLGNMLGTMRGQDLQATLGGRAGAIGAYGTYEGQRTGRYGSELGTPSGAEAVVGGMTGLGEVLAASDERGKTAKTQGGGRQFLDALQDYRYRYRDPRAPDAAPGRQTGIMAQDLERSRLGARAVMPSPAGKMVDTSRLAHALAAGSANLNDRVKRLEGDRRG